MQPFGEGRTLGSLLRAGGFRANGKRKKRRLAKQVVFFGGDEEDRTLDLTDANRTLSQLSYAPKIMDANIRCHQI